MWNITMCVPTVLMDTWCLIRQGSCNMIRCHIGLPDHAFIRRQLCMSRTKLPGAVRSILYIHGRLRISSVQQSIVFFSHKCYKKAWPQHKPPASIAKSNKQWVGTRLYQEECKFLLINCGAVIWLWASSKADCEYPLDANVFTLLSVYQDIPFCVLSFYFLKFKYL